MKLTTHKGFKSFFIVSDCRFVNEFDAFKGEEAIKVRLYCPAKIRKERAEMWRETENHPSETDLDDYDQLGKFNFYYDTELFPVANIVRHLLEHIL